MAMDVEAAADVIQRIAWLVAAAGGLDEEERQSLALRRGTMRHMLGTRGAVEAIERGDMDAAAAMFDHEGAIVVGTDGLFGLPAAVRELADTIDTLDEDAQAEMLLATIRAADDPFVARLAFFWAEEIAGSDGPLDEDEIAMLAFVGATLGLHPAVVHEWMTRTVDCVMSGNYYPARVAHAAGTGALGKVLDDLGSGTITQSDAIGRLRPMLGDVPSSDDGYLSLLFDTGKEGDDALFKATWLLDEPARAGIENGIGLLTWCILYEQFEKARFLMERGIDINAMNPNDTTALGLAIANRQPDSVAFCLDAGAGLDVVAIADIDGSGERGITAAELAGMKDEDCLALIEAEEERRGAAA